MGKKKHQESFADIILRKVYSHPEVLSNYDLLKGIGVLESVEQLVASFKDLEELQQKVIKIFNEKTLEGLYKVINEALIQKFIPTYLLFVINDDPYSDSLLLSCYKNLKKTSSPIKIPSLAPYEELFKKYPNISQFSELKKENMDYEFLSVLDRLDPSLLIPFYNQDKLLGFMVIGKKLLEEAYSDSEIFFIESLVKYSLIAINSIIDKNSAIRDEKTHLYSLAFFKEQLSIEMKRARRHQHSLNLLRVRIIDFSVFSKESANSIVFSLVNLLTELIRDEDTICRSSSDTFFLFFPEIENIELLSIIENIKSKAEKIDVLERKKSGVLLTLEVISKNFDSQIINSVDEFLSLFDQPLSSNEQLVSPDSSPKSASRRKQGLLARANGFISI